MRRLFCGQTSYPCHCFWVNAQYLASSLWGMKQEALSKSSFVLQNKRHQLSKSSPYVYYSMHAPPRLHPVRYLRQAVCVACTGVPQCSECSLVWECGCTCQIAQRSTPPDGAQNGWPAAGAACVGQVKSNAPTYLDQWQSQLYMLIRLSWWHNLTWWQNLTWWHSLSWWHNVNADPGRLTNTTRQTHAAHWARQVQLTICTDIANLHLCQCDMHSRG